MKSTAKTTTLLLGTLIWMTSCTFNPFMEGNNLTGSPVGAAIGAGVGGGATALIGAPKPVIGLMALGGGALGYYMTTLRYDSGGIIQGGGQVYQLGDYTGIDIPTDRLFEVNTADFLPDAPPILDSAVTVLKRSPCENVLVSGNTSGFGSPRREQKLSQERAKKVSAYLWSAGINNFQGVGTNFRRLRYVGYGDYFPIATRLNNEGLRQNSRIQITAYPSSYQLELDKRHTAMINYGGLDEDTETDPADTDDDEDLDP